MPSTPGPRNAFCAIDFAGLPDALWRLTAADGRTIGFAPPVFEIDGRSVTAIPAQLAARESRQLPNGCTESAFEGPLAPPAGAPPGVTLTVTFRLAPDSPVVRFRYGLTGAGALTKRDGRDAIAYARVALGAMLEAAELRLSEFTELYHTYLPQEAPLAERDFAAERSVMGPVLLASDATHQFLLAYEHGSTYPDAFLEFALAAGRAVTLRAVKGNYCSGQPLAAREEEEGSIPGFESVWFDASLVPGTRDDLARAFRHFVRERMALRGESRQPYIFYNTWNYQERKKHWHGTPYLDEMHQERMLREIDAAHRIGIDVFVIDTGWYSRTGDWRVNTERFPDGLRTVKERLDSYGMRLGLWFDNAAALSSVALQQHLDCRCSSHGQVWDAQPIWETEASHRMCLVSRYWRHFADELIRLNREVGVSYFKWDAIGQYGCDDPGHAHGTAAHGEEERRESFAFQLPLYLVRIIERIAEACPGAIVDFDVTETHRAVGLAFLSAGKYFLINNGPYCWNYNVPQKAGWPTGNPNLFFFPGPARTWICRQATAFDRWLPMNLFMAHYLPDDGAQCQVNAVASLILGQNGIWGDLPGIGDAGQALLGGLIGRYKQVRDAIAAAPPAVAGRIGGCPEIHEKIDPATGRGAVVLFATNAGSYEYVTQSATAPEFWATPGVEVTRLAGGHARLRATFRGHLAWGGANVSEVETAKIVYFGVAQ